MVKVKGEPNPEIALYVYLTFLLVMQIYNNFFLSFKDGVKISETKGYYQIIRDHSDKGFYELVIPNVKHGDAGVYKCVASNKFGEASSEAVVTVTGRS